MTGGGIGGEWERDVEMERERERERESGRVKESEMAEEDNARTVVHG